MLKILVLNGAFVLGLRPLHYAAWLGKDQPVQLLLHCGSCVNEPASDGTTPLHMACEHGHIDVVRIHTIWRFTFCMSRGDIFPPEFATSRKHFGLKCCECFEFCWKWSLIGLLNLLLATWLDLFIFYSCNLRFNEKWRRGTWNSWSGVLHYSCMYLHFQWQCKELNLLSLKWILKILSISCL